jgi:hypothetical protein
MLTNLQQYKWSKSYDMYSFDRLNNTDNHLHNNHEVSVYFKHQMLITIKHSLFHTFGTMHGRFFMEYFNTGSDIITCPMRLLCSPCHLWSRIDLCINDYNENRLYCLKFPLRGHFIFTSDWLCMKHIKYGLK